jgi:hypothetical protein
MTEDSLQGRDRIAAAYLQQLQELASEISAATDAISANRLQKFRESVDKQELLCWSLTSMARTVGDSLKPIDQSPAPRIDGQLAERIRAASVELNVLNLKYAALLRRSGRSIALLSLLCKSFSGQYPSAFQPNHHTWSCEV